MDRRRWRTTSARCASPRCWSTARRYGKRMCWGTIPSHRRGRASERPDITEIVRKAGGRCEVTLRVEDRQGSGEHPRDRCPLCHRRYDHRPAAHLGGGSPGRERLYAGQRGQPGPARRLRGPRRPRMPAARAGLPLPSRCATSIPGGRGCGSLPAGKRWPDGRSRRMTTACTGQ